MIDHTFLLKRRIHLQRPFPDPRIGASPLSRLIASFFVSLTVILGFPVASRAKPMRVAVSVFAVGDIVHRIDPEIEIVTAIPPGADPHTFEPAPDLVRKLQKTDVFLGVHPDFDGWIQRILPKSSQTHWFIDAPEAAHGLVNPHLWLSMAGAKSIARQTARILGENDIASKPIIQARLTAFLGVMDSLHAEMHGLFENLPNRKFFQWHPAWNEFAVENGLEVAGVVERGEGQEPSVREIQELIRCAKSTGARVIVMEINRIEQAAETLRGAIDGRIVYLDGIGDPSSPERADYPSLMRFNARTLARALGETAKP
jgi:zinc transport system substrate-binding protein